MDSELVWWLKGISVVVIVVVVTGSVIWGVSAWWGGIGCDITGENMELESRYEWKQGKCYVQLDNGIWTKTDYLRVNRDGDLEVDSGE